MLKLCWCFLSFFVKKLWDVKVDFHLLCHDEVKKMVFILWYAGDKLRVTKKRERERGNVQFKDDCASLFCCFAPGVLNNKLDFNLLLRSYSYFGCNRYTRQYWMATGRYSIPNNKRIITKQHNLKQIIPHLYYL